MSGSRRLQSGVVLPVILIFMIVMTLIGVLGIRNVMLEEKMAGNLRSSQVALLAAEEVLRSCENYIKSDDTPKLYSKQAKPVIGPGEKLPPLDETKWNNEGYVKKVALLAGSTSSGGSCMIEAFRISCKPLALSGAIEWCEAFRVTARGYGTNKDTVVRTQSFMTFP